MTQTYATQKKVENPYTDRAGRYKGETYANSTGVSRHAGQYIIEEMDWEEISDKGDDKGQVIGSTIRSMKGDECERQACEQT